MGRTFTIEINLCETYSVEEIWPDGDAPANPTAEDVRAVFFRERYTNVHQKCVDWGLEVRKEDLRFTMHDPAELQRRLDRARASASAKPEPG